MRTSPGQRKRSFHTPKGCQVAWVDLQSKGALVGYRCGDTGSKWYPTPGGGQSNYPQAFVRGVSTINVPGASISGYGARVGFVLSPRYVRCEKREHDRELTCRVFNEGGAELAGTRRRVRNEETKVIGKGTAMKSKANKRGRAASGKWYAINVADGYRIRKLVDPHRVRGARFAFGPYKSKRKACWVAWHQTGEGSGVSIDPVCRGLFHPGYGFALKKRR